MIFETDLQLVKRGIVSLSFRGVFPNLQEEMPHPPPPHLPSGMDNMAATWCKAEINNARKFQCIVIALLFWLEQINTYLMCTRKKNFGHNINKLTA
jgi:hypothetical protein